MTAWLLCSDDDAPVTAVLGNCVPGYWLPYTANAPVLHLMTPLAAAHCRRPWLLCTMRNQDGIFQISGINNIVH